MATTRLPPDFKEFLKLLEEKGVEYLLIGGYAVGFHGFPRTTGDLDIWIRAEPDNASKVVATFHAFGFTTPEINEQQFLKREKSFESVFHRSVWKFTPTSMG